MVRVFDSVGQERVDVVLVTRASDRRLPTEVNMTIGIFARRRSRARDRASMNPSTSGI
jgi:hypothetical protein